MQPLEMPRSFSFAVHGAVRNVPLGGVLVLSTQGQDVPLGIALTNSISKSNNDPAIAVLTSEDTHTYYVNKIREGGVGRYQNVKLYKLTTGTRRELVDVFVEEHGAVIFIADVGGAMDVMNVYRPFMQTGRNSEATLLIISSEGITPGKVDFDLIYPAGNVQMD